MKIIYLFALLLVTAALTGCTQTAAPIGTDTTTDQIQPQQEVDAAIDNTIVSDNDTVELGELI